MTRQELISQTMALRKLTELEANLVVKLLEAQHIITFTPENELALNPKKFSVGY